MLLFFIAGIAEVKAQKEFVFKSVNASDDAVIKQLNDVFVKNLKRADTLDLTSKLRLQLLVLFDEGYLAASFDSIIKIDSTTIIWSNIGSKYKLVELKTSDEDEGLFAESGVRSRLFRNDVFNPSEFNRFSNRILSWCENNGYPFASAKLDSLQFENSNVAAKLSIEKNVFIKLDSLITEGTGKISQKFLLRYLGMRFRTSKMIWSLFLKLSQYIRSTRFRFNLNGRLGLALLTVKLFMCH
jgi:outer membrane protein assembly factor BamA